MTSSRVSVQLAFLAAVQGFWLCQSACLTMTLVGEARGDFYKQARITAIHGAARDGEDLLVNVAVRARGGNIDPQLLLRVPVSGIGAHGYGSGPPAFEHGDLKLGQPPVGCFEAADTLPSGLQRLLVEPIAVRDYEAFERAVLTLQEGVHVLAVRFDPKLDTGDLAYAPADSVVLDKTMAMALAVRYADGSVRKQFIWGFDEYSRKRGALLLLTPLTVVGDIVTFPLQIIAALLIEC